MRLLLVVPVLLGAALTPAQTTVIVPPEATSLDGNWASFVPFAHAVTRTHHVWSGDAIAPTRAVLSAIAMRSEPNLIPPGFAHTLQDLTVRFGPTSVTPQTMSTRFSDNLTAPMTVVFGGDLNVPQPPPTLAATSPMNIRVPFDSSFVYQRVSGNLIMEMRTADTPQVRTFYFADAVVNGGSGSVFGAGGTTPTGTATLTGSTTDPRTLAPGQVVRFQTRPIVAAGALALGASNRSWFGLPLPFSLAPLGAPGSFVHVSWDVMLPIQPTVALEVPALPALSGQVFYAQSILLLPAANPLGLVTSNAMGIWLRDPAIDPPLRTMGTPQVNAATGSFVNGAPGTGGLVIELTGTFQ